MPLPPGMSPKDANQVLRAVMDDTTNRLRVDAEITAVVTDIEIRASSGDNIAITNQDGTNPLVIEPDGSINTNTTIVGGELAVEIDAADGDNIAISNQAGTNKMEVNVDGSINITDNGGSITVDGTVAATQSGTWNINNITGTVSLPTGASTAANQATEIASLSSIDSKLNTLGQKTSATSVPVVIASDQSPVAVTGTITTSPDVNVHDGTGVVISSTGSSLDVNVTNTVPVSQSTTPWNVNGTVTANQGTAALPGDAWYTRITDGSTTVGLTAFSLNTENTNGPGAAAVNIQDGGNSITVDGTVSTTQGTSPWVDNITQFGSNAVVTGTGASGLGIPRVTVSNDSNILATQSGTWNINNITGTVSLPTGAATSANQTTQITSLQLIDDIPHSANAAFVKGVPMMGQLDDTSTVVATEDNVSVARITAQRALHTNLRNTAGTEIATSANPLRTDPTGTTTQPVSGTVTANQGTSPWVTSGTSTVSGTVSVSNLPTTVDTNYGTVGANTLRSAAQIGNATGAAAFNAGTTTAQTLRVVLPTDQTAIPVTQSGTWTVQPGNTANTTPWLTTDSADGPVTPGTVATKSQLAGGQFNTVAPTLTNTQQVALQVDVNGNLKTSATATVAGNVTVVGNVASSATDSGNPVKVGGIFNSTAPTFTTGQRADLQVDSTGALFINRESQKASYSAAVQFTIAANSTDVFTITGSATKTIRCVKLSVSGTNTGNTNATVFLTRRSTANSGGTSTTATNVASDSTQAAATATVRAYTVNPTLGTTVGNFRVSTLFLPTLASTNQNADVNFSFGDVNNKSIVLRGTSEVIAVNFAGAAITGTTSLSIDITWTEE